MTTSTVVIPQRWRFDWTGLEDKQVEVHNLATCIQQATTELQKECMENGWEATGAIGCGIRNPGEAERIFSPLAAHVGRLHRDLRDLNTPLIYTHGLCCDLVLKESGKVFDPSRDWDKLIENERQKQESLDKKAMM